MRIETEAKLILTTTNIPEKTAEEIVLAAEQHINSTAGVFNMSGGYGRVGVRLHVSGKEPKVTE